MTMKRISNPTPRASRSCPFPPPRPLRLLGAPTVTSVLPPLFSSAYRSHSAGTCWERMYHEGHKRCVVPDRAAGPRSKSLDVKGYFSPGEDEILSPCPTTDRLTKPARSDSAVKQILLTMNEKQSFIIEDLDDFHVVIKADEEYRVRRELEAEVRAPFSRYTLRQLTCFSSWRRTRTV